MIACMDVALALANLNLRSSDKVSELKEYNEGARDVSISENNWY